MPSRIRVLPQQSERWMELLLKCEQLTGISVPTLIASAKEPGNWSNTRTGSYTLTLQGPKGSMTLVSERKPGILAGSTSSREL